ncbi:MAG: hypothetical protein WKF79_00415 [Nocardioides sp.]
MGVSRITDLLASTALKGPELLEVSQPSATVAMTSPTLSAAAADNSFNDSAAQFLVEGFAVGDRVNVTGFTGAVASNILVGVITALTAGKMTIGGTDGDVIADDAAGESVTIAKWETRRSTVAQLAALAVAGNAYRVGWFFTSAMAASEVVLLHAFTKATTFAGNFAGSVAAVDGVAPEAQLVIDVQKNNVSVGSLSVSVGGVATFTSTGGTAVAFAVGDRMKLVGPATVNAATNVSGTFEGTF